MRFSRYLAYAAVLMVVGIGCESDWTPTGPSDGPPEPEGPPVIRSFRVGSPLIDHGDWTNLSWQIHGAKTASISGIGFLSGSDLGGGLLSIRPHETIAYTLTATNDEGSVEATVSVQVDYPAALYVSADTGDDAAAGDTPATALETLDEALRRSLGGGFIFVANGFYQTEIVIDAVDIDITGGLDRDTFFSDTSGQSATIVQPVSGIPLTIRNTPASRVDMKDIFFDTGGVGAVAGLVDGASSVRLLGCTFEGRRSTEGTGLRVVGDSHVEVIRCKLFGGNAFGLPSAETRAIEIHDPASALISHCFVDGGRAQAVCSGIELTTTGDVRIGLCSIAAEISSSGPGNSAAAIRIRQGSPAIGGNLLFARGSGRRFGVAEEAPGTDPRALEYNMFVFATSPYDNFGPNDPNTEQQLNDGQLILEANPLQAYENILVDSVAAGALMEDVAGGDFHLLSRIRDTEQPNPALNRGGFELASLEYLLDLNFGLQDIDDENRPGVASLWDLGADEL